MTAGERSAHRSATRRSASSIGESAVHSASEFGDRLPATRGHLRRRPLVARRALHVAAGARPRDARQVRDHVVHGPLGRRRHDQVGVDPTGR